MHRPSIRKIEKSYAEAVQHCQRLDGEVDQLATRLTAGEEEISALKYQVSLLEEQSKKDEELIRCMEQTAKAKGNYEKACLQAADGLKKEMDRMKGAMAGCQTAYKELHRSMAVMGPPESMKMLDTVQVHTVTAPSNETSKEISLAGMFGSDQVMIPAIKGPTPAKHMALTFPKPGSVSTPSAKPINLQALAGRPTPPPTEGKLHALKRPVVGGPDNERDSKRRKLGDKATTSTKVKPDGLTSSPSRKSNQLIAIPAQPAKFGMTNVAAVPTRSISGLRGASTGNGRPTPGPKAAVEKAKFALDGFNPVV